MVDQIGPVPAVGTVIQYGGAIYAVRNAGDSTLLGIPISCALLAPA